MKKNMNYKINEYECWWYDIDEKTWSLTLSIEYKLDENKEK